MNNDPLTAFQNVWDAIRARCGNAFYPVLLTLLLLLGFAPLLFPGLPAGHDSIFHLTRLTSVAEGLKNGIFPVWINFTALANHGYGTGFFYSDLFLYPFALLIRFGFSPVAAYKFFLLTFGLLAGWSMYYAAFRIGKDRFGAFAAALLYAWSSYFAVDVFTRSAAGEVTAFPFLPLVALGLYHLLYGEPEHFLPLAFGFAGLFYAHSITFVLAAIIAFLFCLCNIGSFLRRPGRIGWGLAAGIMAALLAAAAIAPFLEQFSSLKLWLNTSRAGAERICIADRMVPFTRLFLEIPYMKLANWIPPGIGLVLMIAALQRIRLRSSGTAPERFRDSALIAGAFSLFAASEVFPWEGLMSDLLAPIQFPWRFYLPATAFLALGGGLTLSYLTSGELKKQRYWAWLLIFLCGFAWFFNTAYTYAAKIHERSMWKKFELSPLCLQAASGNHYLPFGVTADELIAHGGNVSFLNGPAPASCVPIEAPYGEKRYRLEGVAAPVSLDLPITPYLGYRAEIKFADGTEEVLAPDYASGAFRVRLENSFDAGELRVFYRNTQAQTVGIFISLAALLAAGILANLPAKKQKKNCN